MPPGGALPSAGPAAARPILPLAIAVALNPTGNRAVGPFVPPVVVAVRFPAAIVIFGPGAAVVIEIDVGPPMPVPPTVAAAIPPPVSATTRRAVFKRCNTASGSVSGIRSSPSSWRLEIGDWRLDEVY